MTRKPDEWMPLHIGAYHADTTHLTRDQHGAYLLLLMAYWRRGGPLPADDARLAAIVKATPTEWRKLKPVMAEFFTDEGAGWVQKRAEVELSKAKRLTEAKADAGRKGAASKWQTHDKRDGKHMAQPSNSHRQTDAPIPSPKPAAAEDKQEQANQIGRLNRILAFSESDYGAFAANIRTLIDLKAEGCDFLKHILPAAEACAGRARSLAYIRPKAHELRDSFAIVAAMPTPFEPCSDKDWAKRLKLFREKAMWSPKWGPKPGEEGCKCPADILEEREAACP